MTNTMERRLSPEILDELEPSDPRAVASRRDLQKVNAVMQNARWLAGLARERLESTRPIRVLDLGGGDGTFLLNFLSRFPKTRWPSRACLLDRGKSASKATVSQFRAFGWELDIVEADALEWLSQDGLERHDLVFANLFLHHFSDADLRRLLESASKITPLFLASEPRRSDLARMACRLLPLLGCNSITRHDAAVSVNAGFRGTEISSLWPLGPDWRVAEMTMGLFTHCFAACREPQDGGPT